MAKCSPSLKLNPVTLAVFTALAGVTTGASAGGPAPGAALGAEFRVNTTTAGKQMLVDSGSYQSHHNIGVDANGDYVITWQSYGQDGYQYGIYAQRYSADGTAHGAEFQVNTTVAANQNDPSIAMDAAGDFVVTWQSYGQDGSSYGVYARRYAPDGTPVSGEFKVNTFTTCPQSLPSAAMDATGDFVIAWMSNCEEPGVLGIYAQRYAADGTARGGEIHVNTYVPDNQIFPQVAMDAAGDFVVAWQSFGQDGSGYGIYAQRYAADGTAQGGEFRVNSTTNGAQVSPTVAMDAAGDFVVAWQSYGQASPNYDVYAQRYAADGTAQGGEFLVNTTTAGLQTFPAVAMDASGEFMVSWASAGQEGAYGGYGIYAQRYAADGTAQGGEFRVNTFLADNQKTPTISMDPAGDAVVAWESNGQDGSSLGVYAQRFTREASLDLSADLSVAPTGTVTPGASLTLTASITSNAAVSTLTGNATIDTALSTASGVEAAITLPTGTSFTSAAGSHWNCPGAPVGNVLTCQYDIGLLAGASTPALTVVVTAPATAGVHAFTNDASGDQPDDISGNNSASAAVTTDHAPVANAGTLTLDQDTSSGGNLSGSDPDNDTLTYIKVADPFHGNVVVNADGSYTYTPAPGYVGLDSFWFLVNDGQFNSTMAMVGITVNHVNHAPVAVNSALILAQDTSSGGNVTATDVDGDTLTYSKVSDSLHGTLTVNSDGSYTYTPTPGYFGTDSFTFKANDGQLDSNPGTVSITVNRTDNAPAANGANLAVNRNTAKAGTVTATDADGDPLTYAEVTAPAHGTLTLNANGSYSYKPAAGYTGADSFAFKANDGMLDSDSATVAVTVTEHAPVGTAQTFSMTHNTVHKGSFKFTDKDTGDKHSFGRVTSPKHGTLVINAGTGAFSYTPAKGFIGKDAFTFKVSDGTKSDTATVSITVK